MIADSGNIDKSQLRIFYAFGAMTIASIVFAFLKDITFLIALPALILVIAYTILDYKSIYFLLLAMLPCSIEYYFPNGLATDLPTEPLMAGLMLVTIALVFFRKKSLPDGFFSQPLIFLLLVHISWIFLCAVNTDNHTVSFKNFLAKLWYFIPFTILTAIVMRKGSDLKKFFWCMFIPLTILVAITVLRHGILYKFYFQDVNKSVTPYFRNHVNYAAMMSVFFPCIVWAVTWYKKGTNKRALMLAAVVFYLIAVYLSYTRTAMLAILAMIPIYYMIKWKLTKISIAALVVILTIGIANLFYQNHYLKYAPNYDDTIYHDDFSSHLSSTFEGKDVSSMERVYRWVAASRMWHDRPLMGVGPGNFANYYKSYTVTDFETYISDNEEHSTVHNYFLLMLVEQGWIGLIIFLTLVFASLIYGEYIYTKMKTRENKNAVMMLLILMFSVIFNLLLSDMMETDKVGPFFFLVIGLLVSFDLGVLSMEPDSQ